MLTIEILGPVQAHRDGDEIDLGGPVDRGVLGLLAARVGQRVSADDLLAAAYPGVARASARPALHSALWRLRRALGDDASLLVTERGGYRLDLPADRTDAGAARTALAAAGTDDREEAVAKLAAVEGSWRGPVEVPGSVGAELDDLVGRVVETLAELLLADGRVADAVEPLRRLLAVQPHRAAAAALLDAATGGGNSPATDAVSSTDGDRNSAARDLVRMVLSAAAVLGPATLAELTGTIGEAGGGQGSPVEATAILDAVEAAAAHGLVAHELPDAPGTVRYSWDGNDGFGAEVSATALLRLHAAAATTRRRLLGDVGPHMGAVADHLAAAVPLVELDSAVDTIAELAEANRNEPSGVAVTMTQRGLDLVARWAPADHARQARLLITLGRALDADGAPDHAVVALERAVELAAAHDLGDELAMAALELAGTVYRPRAYDGAESVLEQAMEFLPDDRELRSAVILRRFQLDRYRVGDHNQAQPELLADHLLVIGCDRDDQAARSSLRLARWLAGIEDGEASFDDDELDVLVADAGDVPTLAYVTRRWAITCLSHRGQFDAAERALGDLNTRIPELRAAARSNVGADDFAAARQSSYLQLLFIRAHQGRVDEIMSLFDGARRNAPPGGVYVDLHARSVGAQLEAIFGDRVRAAEILGDILDDLWTLPQGRFRFATAHQAAVVAAELADESAMARLREELAPSRGRHVVVGVNGYSGVAEQVLGRLHAGLGDLDAADECLAAALDAHVTVGSLVYANLSRQFRAGVLRRLGGAARLDEAAALDADADRVRAEFGLRSPRPSDASATPR